jgi:DNA-binding FrmR family transcriptional regulator
MRKDIKASCQKRLSRIEGQVRGLAKMVDEDRYCIDIVTQISAGITCHIALNTPSPAATSPISVRRFPS